MLICFELYVCCVSIVLRIASILVATCLQAGSVLPLQYILYIYIFLFSSKTCWYFLHAAML